MQIIERFLMGKRSDQDLCEDGIFANENFIAVVDGVTSKGKQKWQGKLSSGGYAKEVILRELAAMPRDIDRDGFFIRLDNALLSAYEKDIVTDDLTEYLRACMIVYSAHYNELWSVGDCQFLINGVGTETGKGIDSLMSDLRAFVIEEYLINGGREEDLYTNDVGRTAITPFLNVQLSFENRTESDFGYAVLNGHGVKLSAVRTYPVSNGDTVVLASDGYPVLCDTLEKSESELKRAVTEDPLCYKEFRGTKGIQAGNSSFDDRSYIKFIVGE